MWWKQFEALITRFAKFAHGSTSSVMHGWPPADGHHLPVRPRLPEGVRLYREVHSGEDAR